MYVRLHQLLLLIFVSFYEKKGRLLPDSARKEGYGFRAFMCRTYVTVKARSAATLSFRRLELGVGIYY